MRSRTPDGCIGIIIFVILLIIGVNFDIEWARLVGGWGTVLWIVMASIGFLAGAKA